MTRLHLTTQLNHNNRVYLLMIWVVGVYCLTVSPFVPSALAQPTNAAASKYQSNYGTIKELGKDLYEALKPNYRVLITPNPIWYNPDIPPYIRPFQFVNENNPQRIVYVSQGFIQLVNSIAHAKAIDKIEPGFFASYIKKLSQETGGQLVPDLPEISDPKYWTDDVINEQLSYFNQIVGALAAINLAHHYLGHEQKYGELLHDSPVSPVTMATTCTQAEWDEALKLGAQNALDCGFGVEGLKAFYDCILSMEKRPGWTFYFLPLKVRVDNLAKTKRTLDEIENRFFGQK